MKFELSQHNRNATDDELIVDLKRVASLLGKDTVTVAEQNEHGRFNAMTLRRRFNGWKEALEIAGLEHGKRMNIPEEELFEHIEELWTRLGRQPHFRDLLADGRFGGNTYIRRFGTWQKALEAFVTYVNSDDTVPEQPAEATSTGRRSRKHGKRDINWRLRFIVMRHDNFRCRLCGQTQGDDPSTKLEVDHIKAWIKGGLTAFENLQTLCRKCNAGKSDLELMNAFATEVQNVET